MNKQNSLFMKALKGLSVDRPPVWMMRQAGRYLPDFMALKNQYDFFKRCETPELAAQITIMPIDQIGVDAAILFSDILVIPKAMGMGIYMDNGPVLSDPIRCSKDIDQLICPDVADALHYVFEAINLVNKELPKDIPLIGFAGAPWTVFCYMVEGGGSRSFEIAKTLCFKSPELAKALLDKITKVTIAYLKEKVTHGVQAIQIFDSWANLLSEHDYSLFSWPYIEQIVESLCTETEVILFCKGAFHSLKKMGASKASAIGIDWGTSALSARTFCKGKTLQGNFDPVRLLGHTEDIPKLVKEMIDAFGPQKYIVNLGHGILPNTPIENAKAFVESVKRY